MAGNRRINWGADATDARYRTEDTGDGANFVVAEDLDGSTVLLEYDDSATPSEWKVRGPVEMNSNDISGVGTVTASTVNATSLTHNGDKSLKYTSITTVSRSFGNWYEIDPDRPGIVVVQATTATDGSTNGKVNIELDKDGDSSKEILIDSFAYAHSGLGGDTFIKETGGFAIPAGGQYLIEDTSDPRGGSNSIDKVVEVTL